MSTPVIIDAVVAALLIAFCLWGAYRGLFRSLAGLVILVVSLVGASMMAAGFTPGIVKLVTPMVQNGIMDYVEEAAEVRLELPDAEIPEQVRELLESMGLDRDVRDDLRQRTEEAILETGTDVVTALVESILHGLVYAILFALSFLGLMVLLHVLLNAMDLVLKLPGLHLLNTLGGAVTGLIQGGLLLFLAVWILRRFGVSFDTEPFAGTRILAIFTTYTPLSVLSLL